MKWLALVAFVACLALWFSWDDAGRQADVARARRAEQQVTIWKAKYAEAAMQTARDGTVYVRARARVDTLRDSIPVWQHDTTYVREFVTRTDSALSACDALRRSCLALSEAADSTIRVSQGATDWYKGEAAKQKRQARAWKLASAALGGFIVWRVAK